MRVVKATTDPVASEVGSRIQAEMDRQHIRQTAVAVRLGISQQAVSRRISGAVPFNVAELEAIARLLNVPAAQFLPTSTEAAA